MNCKCDRQSVVGRFNKSIEGFEINCSAYWRQVSRINLFYISNQFNQPKTGAVSTIENVCGCSIFKLHIE